MSALANLGHRILGTRQIDQLIRFVPVLDALRDVAPGRLLDVGSGSTGIAPLLPNGWRVTALDANFADYGATVTGRASARRVLGDVRRLPFPDAAFDVVVAVDLLEHVAPEGRGAAIDELCRVARHRAIVACPTGAAALTADRNIKRLLEARGTTVPPWLDEHLDNGFPERTELAEHAARHGAVNVEGNESASAHERVTLAELRLMSAVPLRLAARALARALRRTAFPGPLAANVIRRLGGHDREPTYRSVICVDVEPRHSTE